MYLVYYVKIKPMGRRKKSRSNKSVIGFIMLLALVGSIAAYVFYNSSPTKDMVTPTPTSKSGGMVQSAVAKNKAGNIQISFPVADQIVKSPLTVVGAASTFEQELVVRLVEKQTGKVIVSENVSAEPADPGEFGGFEATLKFNSNAKDLILEAYAPPIKDTDAAQIDKVSISLIQAGK